MKERIVLASGGTGGHMFPAAAVADELRARALDPLLVCDRRGARYLDPALPRRIIQAGSPSGSLKRRIEGALRLLLGTIQSAALLIGRRPRAVVCFGGYAALPMALAARLLRVPLAVHEQNAVLGRANRIAARRAALLALTFEATRGLPEQPGARRVVTGNPVRAAVREHAGARYQAPAPDGPLHLLVVGGSQGARRLSEVVPAAVEALPAGLRARLVLTQQCRPEDLDRVRAAYAALGFAATLRTFFDDLPARLATSHLVISRSGASSVAELLVLGRPSVLVPYRHAADDHQRANADVLAERGAAWMMAEEDLDARQLAGLLQDLMQAPERLERAARQATALARPDAAAALADALAPLLEPRPARDGEEVLA